ncbi:MAG: LPXTG cell wall anchor domain-containing protein [Anaerovoracaceae bacterium]
MKKIIKKMFSVLLALTVVLSFSVNAFAADAGVTYKGQKDMLEFHPGSVYTDSDLFANFKGVMPGDSLVQKITVSNTASDCDYIKVYLKALPHDAEKNPLSEKVKDSGETVDRMTKFLSQLILILRQGETEIFRGTAAEAGTLENGVYLGNLGRNESLDLEAQLYVPLSMGNEFANRVGEIDWVFKVEALDYPAQKYTVLWNNYDGTNLETDYYNFYDMPTYDGPTPVRPEDDLYTYEFIGWDKEIVRVTQNAVYTARYKAIPKEVNIDEPETPLGPSDPDKPGKGENVDDPDVPTGSYDSNGNHGKPKTGDDQNMLFWLLLMAAAGVGGVVTVRKARKEK